MSSNKTESSKKQIPVGYHIYLYREELRKPKMDKLKLSKAKYTLTSDLVVTTCQNIECYKREERTHLIDSMAYKMKLKQRLEKKSKKRMAVKTGNSKK